VPRPAIAPPASGGPRTPTANHPAVPVGNVLYFEADDGTRHITLWRTDGTPPGTAFVADLVPGAPQPQGWGLGGAAAVGGTLFFTYPTGSGASLFRTDGTAAGTRAVAAAG